jgi:hypothetical protein
MRTEPGLRTTKAFANVVPCCSTKRVIEEGREPREPIGKRIKITPAVLVFSQKYPSLLVCHF